MDRRPFAEHRLEVGCRDGCGVQGTDPLAQRAGACEGLLHSHLLIEREADQKRHRVLGDQPVGLVGIGEVQAVWHGRHMVPRRLLCPLGRGSSPTPGPALSQLLAYRRSNDGPEQLSRPHHVRVSNCADAHLCDVALVGKQRLLEQDLLAHPRSLPRAQHRLHTVTCGLTHVSWGITELQNHRGRGEVKMLVTLVIVLLVLAVVGGVAVHPLLFLLALLAVLMFFSGRGRSVA